MTTGSGMRAVGDKVQETIKEEDEEEEEEDELPDGVRLVRDVLLTGEIFESPIDISIPKSTRLDLPPLEFHHMSLPPKKVKLTNTGHTVILSAKWLQERPFLSGGPFAGNYVFSQLHFHWGSNNMEGSEHTVAGAQHPLEMHAVFFKSCYLTQESALRKKDGLCIVCYLFQLQEGNNPAVEHITESFVQICEPRQSVRLRSLPLETYMKPFHDDYFLYAGSVNTSSCVHYILWLVSREPMGISVSQMDKFRELRDAENASLLRNFRQVQPMSGRTLYHANPSRQLYSTLFMVSRQPNPSQPQQVNKYPQSSREFVPVIGPMIYDANAFSASAWEESNLSRKRRRSSVVNSSRTAQRTARKHRVNE